MVDDVANEVNRICLRMFLAASRARIVVASLIRSALIPLPSVT
jgi:hypothetical protein